jgi:glycosyltransferase involved in cell wall biosynthesis
MRAAVHNPYLDTLGGGERYTMAFAATLGNLGYRVDVEWKNPKIGKKLEERFGLSFERINFIPDIKRGDGYDVCFWLSDGSIPVLRARKNFLHFQHPFKGVGGSTLLNRMKLFRINKVLCNSNFTKRFIDEEYKVNSTVLYPAVSTEKIKPHKKENIILFVGRFSQLEQAKNQHILISVFRDIYDRGEKDFKLVLAGGSEVGVGGYIKRLKRLSQGYPVEIIESPKYKDLVSIYGRAKIFWSAVGFGVDEEKEPKKVEHFGITVVEAMAGGAVPVIFSGGGYKEIVRHEENGFLWKKKGELIKITGKLIKDAGLYRKISANAIKASGKYSFEKFAKNVEALL